MNTMDLTTLAGVAINGVAILSSSSMEKVDPYFPKLWSGATSVQAEMVDACLAHPQVAGIYHYHILSPCILSSAGIQTSSACVQIGSCASDIRSYAISAYSTQKKEILLGVAKDGHMILGPYKDDGTKFSCSSYDQCGGLTSADGSYVYNFNNRYPYTMDCFGPAV